MEPSSQSSWSARQHYESAVSAHRLGRFGEAERHYKWVLEQHRDHPGTLHNLALLFLQSGRPIEAAQTYEKVLRGDRNDVVAHTGLGHVLHVMERDEEALAHLRRALVLKPDYAEAHANLGNVLVALNRHQEAIDSYVRASALNPGLVEPYNNRGNVLASLGRHDEAVVEFEKALALHPAHVSAMENIGNSLSTLGRHEQAIVWFERAQSLEPGNAAVENSYGMALARMKRHEDAVAHYQRALTAQPDSPGVLANLGNALDALVRPAEALEIFERLLAIEPDNAWGHFCAGNAHRILGRLDEARRCYEGAVELAPRTPAFHRGLAEVKRFQVDDPQIAILEDLLLHAGQHTQDERIELHFALAKVCDDIGRNMVAFTHLNSGNALKRQMTDYDEAAQLGVLANIATVFTPELMATRRGRGDPSDLPIFIVGMPRSGTTLVEQLLASHRQVYGGGELPFLPDLVSNGSAGAGFPLDFPSLESERLRALGSLYIARLQSLAPQTGRITDKMPFNFSVVGLIHLALPNARIIHVRRDPVDTCYSCYANLFSQGMEFTYDLGELGRHYRAYERLMEHWRAVLPEGVMLDVQYEDLVADFEAQARRIVAYCALPWDDRCLFFYETERAVRTASATQVRRPVYASSLGRWRPYQDRLGPLFDALECAA